MVKYSSDELDKIFHALSDPTRRALLSRLSQGNAFVTELSEPFNMSLTAVSKHLKVLEDAKFVQRTKEGRAYLCQADLEPLNHVAGLLEELGSFWRGRLDALDDYFKNKKLSKEK